MTPTITFWLGLVALALLTGYLLPRPKSKKETLGLMDDTVVFYHPEPRKIVTYRAYKEVDINHFEHARGCAQQMKEQAARRAEHELSLILAKEVYRRETRECFDRQSWIVEVSVDVVRKD